MEPRIHQIWVGPHRLPAKEKAFIQAIKAFHPYLQHTLWTDDNLPTLPDPFPALMRKFGERRDWAFQADILRVFLTHAYGGLYIDADFELGDRQGLHIWNLNVLDGFFLGHGGDDYTLSNECFGVAKDSHLSNWLLSGVTADGDWFGPSWLGDRMHALYGYPRVMDFCLLEKELAQDNAFVANYDFFERNCLRHRGLASWTPEGKALFRSGEYA